MNQDHLLHNNHSVFIDQSAFQAYLDSHDPRHIKARSLFLELDDLERPLVTTNFIVFEIHDWLRDQAGYDSAQFFLNAIEKTLQKGLLSVLPIHEEFEHDARELLLEYPEHEFSLVEALTVAVVGRHQIQRVFSFNPKFRQIPKLRIMPSSTF
jgi:predicted nucleic acid-binding protein